MSIDLHEQISKIVRTIANGQIKTEWGVEAIIDTVALQPQTETESLLGILWAEIIDEAARSATSHSNLVDLLVILSRQADVLDDSGKSIKIYGAQLWRDLPMLGWYVNGIWNSLDITSVGAQRKNEISTFVNKVRFVGSLIGTSEFVFQPFTLQALWTFRALEEPSKVENSQLDIWIPAIAGMIDTARTQLETVTDEFAPDRPGAGRPAKGGPLWTGRDGFSKERWQLWQKRLQEIAADSTFDTAIRQIARGAGEKMSS